MGIITGTREDYLQKVEAQLNQWDAEIEELKTETYKTKVETELEHLEQIEALRAQREAAWEALHALREASDEAWEDLRAEVEHIVYKLRKTLNRVAAQLR